MNGLGSADIIRANALALPLADESIQCVVTSPPYNVGIDYDAADDSMAWEDYEAMTAGACSEMERVLVDGGRAWVNVTPIVPEHPGSERRVSLMELWARQLRAVGLEIREYVCWPTSGRGPSTAWGSWQSPSAPNLRGEWEVLIVAYKGSWSRSAPPEAKGWKDRLGEWTGLVTNVWRMKPQSRDANGHPAPFPAELAQRAIRLSTWPGETVLDPFCGGGTTVRAALDLGRRGVGSDISDAYCNLAKRLLAQGTMFGA